MCTRFIDEVKGRNRFAHAHKTWDAKVGGSGIASKSQILPLVFLQEALIAPVFDSPILAFFLLSNFLQLTIFKHLQCYSFAVLDERYSQLVIVRVGGAASDN